jgi:hypothetical protein
MYNSQLTKLKIYKKETNTKFFFIYQYLVEKAFINNFQQNKKKPTRIISIASYHKLDEFSSVTADRYSGNIYNRLSFYQDRVFLRHRGFLCKLLLSYTFNFSKVLTTFKKQTKLN